MKTIEQNIMNSLFINMGYKKGERVAIIMQEWNPKFKEDLKIAFEKSKELCLRMYEIFRTEGIEVELLSYIPQEARNGIDATADLYEKIGVREIIFMPTVFSLTHTHFRKEQTSKGSRVASMPGFTLEMFEEDGPMNLDYLELDKKTKEVAEILRRTKLIKVQARDTEFIVEPDNNLVRNSSGLLTNPGQWGNLPGAEAYVVPKLGGKTEGYFTVPAGWGGSQPLKYSAKFIIKNARFVDIIGDSPRAQKYLDENIKPLFFEQQNFNVVAEFGIGTNPKITSEYINKHGWSTLLAEKIYGSVHLANGNNYSMGGQNDVPIHIDWVIPDVKIEYNL